MAEQGDMGVGYSAAVEKVVEPGRIFAWPWTKGQAEKLLRGKSDERRPVEVRERKPPVPKLIGQT